MSLSKPIGKAMSPITAVSTAILREIPISQKNRNMLAIGLSGFKSALIVSLVITYYNTWYLQDVLGLAKNAANGIFSYSTAAGAIGLLIAVIVGGAYSDDYRSKYGARAPFILSGTLLTGFMIFLIPIIATIFPRSLLIILFPLTFFIAYAGLGLGASPANALLSELFTREQRGWVGLALAGFTTLGSFTGIIGLRIVADSFSTTAIFPVTGITTMIIGVAIFYLMEKVNPPFDPIDPTIEDIINTPKFLFTYGGKDFGKMLIVQSLWGFAIASVSVYMLIHLGTPAAVAAIGENNEGLVLIVTGVVAALMAIPAGLTIKKIGKVNTAIFGSIVYAIYCFLFAYIEIGNYFSLLLVVAALGGLGAIFIEAVSVSLPADLVPEGKEAQFMGIDRFASTWTQPLVALIGAQILVVFAGNYPTTVIFNLAGIASVLASFVLLLINYEKMLMDEYQNFYKRYVRARGFIEKHLGEITDGFMSKI
ncbi:MAG: MFS transporter [Candidatus Hodarchaeales archaeon]|jgi:MFS family permease